MKKSKQENIFDFEGSHIHMIGIGGSSMSGLAELLLHRGFTVSGSDQSAGKMMNLLKKAGAGVTIGHKPENVHGADLVVYTAAVPKDHIELQEADRLGIPTMERAELLAQLMSVFPCPVGVCGTHGKTTTTAMIGKILLDAGMDPAIHIGGRYDPIGGSIRDGNGEVFVSEACEFNRSFLHMRPFGEVVLNIDADHLDCYRDLDEIEETFGQFMSYVPENGFILGRGTDPRVRRQMEKCSCRKYTYGISDTCDFYAKNLEKDEKCRYRFTVMENGSDQAVIQLKVPGVFNVENAVAAFGASRILGVDPKTAAQSLSEFTGVHQRFEYFFSINGADFYHDYGHNPVEIRNAVSVARYIVKRKLYALIEPFTYSRVKSLFDGFVTCTEDADVTLIFNINPAREEDPGDINSTMLVDAMNKAGNTALFMPSWEACAEYLLKTVGGGDIVLGLGCGSIPSFYSFVKKCASS